LEVLEVGAGMNLRHDLSINNRTCKVRVLNTFLTVEAIAVETVNMCMIAKQSVLILVGRRYEF